MHYRVVEDVVERRLELVGRRSFGQALAHTLLTLIIVGFVAAFFIAITASFASKLPLNWISRFDVWWRLIAAELILGLPALLVGYFFLRGIAAHYGGGWRRLSWDERLAEFSAMKRIGILRLASYSTIPFAELESIAIHASPGGRNLALKLSVSSNNFVNYPFIEAAGTVRHVDRREEAMDLLFRIGRTCGLDYYAVEDSDIRNLKLCVERRPRDRQNEGRFQPIPSLATAARYDEDRTAVGIAAPTIQVGPFHPATLKGFARGTQLIEWKPGEHVEFHSPAADRTMYAVYGVLAAAAGGFLAYHFAPLAGAWLPGWATMIVAAAIAPLGASGWIWLRYPERNVTIDWLTQQVAWRSGRRSRQAPLAAARAVVLRGLKRTVSRKKQPTYEEYWGRLELELERGTVFVIASDAVRRDPDGPTRQLGPLAAALAESLGVPWQWRDYQA